MDPSKVGGDGTINTKKREYSTIEWSGFSAFLNKQRIKFQHDLKNNMSEKEYMLNARKIFDSVDRYGSGILAMDDFYMALRFDTHINQLFQPSLVYGLDGDDGLDGDGSDGWSD